MSQEIGPWEFHIVTPDHPDGIVSFTFGIQADIAEALENRDKMVWTILLKEVQGTAEKIAGEI